MFGCLLKSVNKPWKSRVPWCDWVDGDDDDVDDVDNVDNDDNDDNDDDDDVNDVNDNSITTNNNIASSKNLNDDCNRNGY